MKAVERPSVDGRGRVAVPPPIARLPAGAARAVTSRSAAMEDIGAVLLESNKLLLVPRRSLAAVSSSLLLGLLCLLFASTFRPLAWKAGNTAPTLRTQYPPRPDGSKRTRRPGQILVEIVVDCWQRLGS